MATLTLHDVPMLMAASSTMKSWLRWSSLQPIPAQWRPLFLSVKTLRTASERPWPGSLALPKVHSSPVSPRSYVRNLMHWRG